MLDVVRDPRWGRSAEGSGEDPYLGAVLAAARVRGFQGADLKAFNRKLALDHTAPALVEMKAPRAGFVSACNARIIGEVVRDLGGGRLTKESVINYQVGVDGLAKPGEKVGAGSVLARIHAADSASAEATVGRFSAAFEISDEQPRCSTRVEKIVNPSETS